MLYEYKCRDCGELFEQRKPSTDRHTGTCTCGGGGELQFARSLTVHIPAHAAPATSVNFSEIAPLDDLGHPMGKREAAKVVDVYDPDSVQKAKNHESSQEERLTNGRKERAKRTAWKQISETRRITVGGD